MGGAPFKVFSIVLMQRCSHMSTFGFVHPHMKMASIHPSGAGHYCRTQLLSSLCGFFQSMRLFYAWLQVDCLTNLFGSPLLGGPDPVELRAFYSNVFSLTSSYCSSIEDIQKCGRRMHLPPPELNQMIL